MPTIPSLRGRGGFQRRSQIRVAQIGADTIVHVNTSGAGGSEMQIVLLNVTAADLTAADFLL